MSIQREKGFVNVHIDITTKQVYVSNKPYATMQEAETGIFIGFGIEKVGCFEIEYTKNQETNDYERT
jgi:hypothetical protein